MGTTGCQAEFEPEWRLTKSRILGIQSDPALLDEGETSQLDALVYTVPDDSIESIDWTWCPVPVRVENRYRCPREQLDRVAERLAGNEETRQLAAFLTAEIESSGEDEVSLSYPTDRETTLQFCRWLQQGAGQSARNPFGSDLSPFDCERGLETPVRLEVSTENRELIARKKIRLATTGDTQPDRNPEIDAISIRTVESSNSDGDTTTLDWERENSNTEGEWYEIGEEETIALRPDETYELQTELTEDSIEIWRPPARIGAGWDRGPLEREVIGFRWYTELGDLSRPRRIYDPNPGLESVDNTSRTNIEFDGQSLLDECERLESSGNTGEENGACRIEVWSVVRDDRLGIDWDSIEIRIEPRDAESTE